MEGELTDGFPAFDAVEGDCQLGDDSFSVAAVVPHDVKGKEFLEAMAEEDTEAYAVQSGKWALLVDGTDEEDLEVAETAADERGGKVDQGTPRGAERV